jgi:hypothetical protein
MMNRLFQEIQRSMHTRIPWIFLVACTVGILIVLAFVLQPYHQVPDVAQEAEGVAEYQAEDSLIEFVQTPWTGDLDGMLEQMGLRPMIYKQKAAKFRLYK